MTDIHPRLPRRIPTPAASRRTHLLAASLLWSLVGLGLTIAGASWISDAGPPHAVLLAAVAIVLGLLKVRFILSHNARRVIDRIERRGDGRCIGGFLSWKTWVLVLAMVALGRVLRATPLPVPIRGTVYSAIGVALFTASCLLWRRWWTAGEQESS